MTTQGHIAIRSEGIQDLGHWSMTKPYFEEPRVDYRDRDLERGGDDLRTGRKHSDCSEASVDGFNYEDNKVREWPLISGT